VSIWELDRNVARRWTRVALGMAGGLLALGVWYGAWFLAENHTLPGAATILERAAAEVPRPAPMRVVSASVDPVAAGMNLSRIANRPTPPAPTLPGVPNGPSQEPTRPALSVRFLGVIAEPDRLLALVHAGTRQRVVGPGALIPADAEGSRLLRVQSITREALLLRDGDKEVRVERAARTGPPVTYVAGNPALAAAGQVQLYNPPGSVYTPPAVAGPGSMPGQALSSFDRTREMQRRFGGRRDLVSAVPDVTTIAGDSPGDSEADGVPAEPLGIPKAVPITPDNGVKPK
jgi:hypothetical protein